MIQVNADDLKNAGYAAASVLGLALLSLGFILAALRRKRRKEEEEEERRRAEEDMEQDDYDSLHGRSALSISSLHSSTSNDSMPQISVH